MKILIAEDDKLILKTLELLLTRLNYEIVCCEDGLEAMDQIERQNPDVIIVDIMLPYFSGLEILGRVKQTRSDIPVIVISAMGQQTVIEEAKSLGADLFISKPFNINSLVIEINKLTDVKAMA